MAKQKTIITVEIQHGDANTKTKLDYLDMLEIEKFHQISIGDQIESTINLLTKELENGI
jgi:hypothetical protein